MTSSLGENYYPPVINGSQYKKGLGMGAEKIRYLMFTHILDMVLVAASVDKLIAL
jgi:hypothetical protein